MIQKSGGEVSIQRQILWLSVGTFILAVIFLLAIK